MKSDSQAEADEPAGQGSLKLTHHRHRVVLGDKATFETGLRAELVR